MREIKFRAWLKEHKTMVNVAEIDINHQLIYHYGFDDFEGNFENFNSIELLQYTGLKDKNENEIYEGDIVEFDDYDRKSNYLKNVAVVVREDNVNTLALQKFKYDNTKFTNRYMDYIENIFENSKVIGNIYENPELLGVS